MQNNTPLQDLISSKKNNLESKSIGNIGNEDLSSLIQDKSIKKEKIPETKSSSMHSQSNWIFDNGYDFILGAIQGAANVPPSVIDFFRRVGVPFPKPPMVNIAPNTTSSDIGGILGETAGLYLSGLGELKAARLLPRLAKTSPLISAVLSGAIQGSLSSGISAAPYQNTSLPMAMAVGGILGGTASAALSQIMPFLLTSKISPLKLIPHAKELVARKISEIKGNMSKGLSPNDANNNLFKIISQHFEELKGDMPAEEYVFTNPMESASSLYDMVASRASKLKLPFDNTAIKESINKEIGYVNSVLKKFDKKGNAYKRYSEIKETLESYLPKYLDLYLPKESKLTRNFLQKIGANKDFESPISPKEPFELYSLRSPKVASFDDAKFLKEEINKDIFQARKDGNFDLSKTLGRIKENGIMKSIKDNAANDPILEYMLRVADSKYRAIMQVFKNEPNGKTETEFYKLFYQDDPNTDKFISHYLKTGEKQDQVTKLQQLFDMLPKNSNGRDMVSSWYFKDADTSEKFMSAYHKLGARQKELLLGQNSTKFEELDAIQKRHPYLFKEDKDTYKGFRHSAETIGAIMSLASGHPYVAAGLIAEPLGNEITKRLVSRRPDILNKYIMGGFENNPNLNMLQKAIIYSVTSAANKIFGEKK